MTESTGRVRELTKAETIARGGGARTLKIGLLVAMLLIVPVVGFTIVKLQGPHLEREAYSDLSVIAELKGSQIENWLAERDGDGATLMNDPAFIAQVAGLQRAGGKPGAKIRQELTQQLESRMQAYGYDDVLLLDPQGQLLLALGDHNDIHVRIKAHLSAAFAGRQIQHGDLLSGSGASHIDFVVPLMTREGNRQSAVGAVVLRVDPHHFLFPFIQKWPAVSQSGETLLVRRDGDTVLFLNELRHRKGDALPFRLSLATPDLPAVVAVRENRPGTVAGRDYRGMAVLAAYRPVAGTDWHIVAKFDHDEVMAPLREMVFWISLVALLGIASLGAALLLLWRQQQRMQALVFLAEKTKSERLFQQFFDLPFIGMAITSPETKRFEKFNDRLCEMLGYSREEFAGMSWAELMHPEDTEANLGEFDRIMRGESEGFATEKRYIRKDGSDMLAAIDVKCVRRNDGAVDYFCTTVQDITRRKRVEQALLQSEQDLRRAQAIAHIGSWNYNLATGQLAWSDELYRIYGVSRETFTPSVETLINLIHPDDRAAMRAWIAACTAGNKPKPLEFRCVWPDGTVRYVVGQGELILDAAGKPVRMAGAGQDITERRVAEAQRLEKLEELRRWHDITMGREMRVLELKREVNELLGQAGQPLRYASADGDIK